MQSKFLVMSQSALDLLQSQRMMSYSGEFMQALNFDPDKEKAILRYFCAQLIVELKRRRLQPSQPYLIYKIIECAVQLFRRYYLANALEGSNPKQKAFLAIYIALKLEHIDLGCMIQLRNKFTSQHKLRDIVHFNQDNYSGLQLQFLIGIEFDMETGSIFRPIESLMHALKQVLPEPLSLDISKTINTLAFNFLCGSHLFLLDLPLVSLALFVTALERHSVPVYNLPFLEEFGGTIASSKFRSICQLVRREQFYKNSGYSEFSKLFNYIKQSSFTMPTVKRISSGSGEPALQKKRKV